MTHQIQEEIEVRAPVPEVYKRWTKFEDFAQFMEGIEEVRQTAEDRFYWHAEILGHPVKWEAMVKEQIPNRLISWESVSGHPNRGSIAFIPVDALSCKVLLIVEYEPLGVAEEIGDALGLLSCRIKADLGRFKERIETPLAA